MGSLKSRVSSRIIRFEYDNYSKLDGNDSLVVQAMVEPSFFADGTSYFYITNVVARHKLLGDSVDLPDHELLLIEHRVHQLLWEHKLE